MTQKDDRQAVAPTALDEQPELIALQDRFRSHIARLNENSLTGIPIDLSKIFPEAESLQELTTQVDDLKRCLDSFRPLDQAQLENLRQAFDIEYTYESNRIEGNTLTLRETDLVVTKGMTIGGKPLRDHLEAINHQEAIAYVRDIVRDGTPITEAMLKGLHGIILRGIDRDNAGRYRSLPVRIQGSAHLPPQPYLVPKLMEGYFEVYEANRTTAHPVILAADMHERLVTIHPFIDGNGRTARLIMNLVLLQHGYVVANMSGAADQRAAYYEALETRNATGDGLPLHRVILRAEKASLIAYLNLMEPQVEQGRGGYFLQRIKPFL